LTKLQPVTRKQNRQPATQTTTNFIRKRCAEAKLGLGTVAIAPVSISGANISSVTAVVPLQAMSVGWKAQHMAEGIPLVALAAVSAEAGKTKLLCPCQFQFTIDNLYPSCTMTVRKS
jgi:hypothetical protein